MAWNAEEWPEMHSVLFSPEVIKLGIIVVLERACSHNKSMHNLELFINALVYEKKKIILNETGMYTSSSLFIPYEIMPENVITIVGNLMDSKMPRSVFKKNEALHVFFELPVISNTSNNQALGAVSVVCGLLLAIQQATISKKNKQVSDHKLCVFDVILKSVFFKHRIDYAVVLRDCIRYGYCAASELEAITDSNVGATSATIQPKHATQVRT